MTAYANPHSACDNVGGLGEHLTCRIFRFLSYRFSFFLFYLYFIIALAHCLHRSTSFDDLYDVFPRKEVPFVVAMRLPI